MIAWLRDCMIAWLHEFSTLLVRIIWHPIPRKPRITGATRRGMTRTTMMRMNIPERKNIVTLWSLFLKMVLKKLKCAVTPFLWTSILFFIGQGLNWCQKMDEIEKCRKHFHMLLSLRGKALQRAIDKLPNHTIRCLYRIAVNLVFSPYNGLRTHSDLIKKKIFPHKKILLKLIKERQRGKQRKLLKKGGITIAILSLLAAVIASVASIM